MKSLNRKIQEENVVLLKEVLADQFLLYTKSRNYHWNVTGQNFFGLHSTFEKIYDELAEDIDVIAERIRVLGSKAPGTLKEFLSLSSIKEEEGSYPLSNVLVQNLVKDIEVVNQKLANAARKFQDSNDEVTAGLLYSMVEKYEKTNWMLKSLAE